MTRTSTDAETLSYELNRLNEFLMSYEETPQLRAQMVKAIDYAAWEQLTTALRALRQTVRSLESQIRGPRFPSDDDF